MASSQVAMAAKRMRRTVAGGEPDDDGFAPLLLRQSGGSEPDDDGIVSSEDQVDQDHLEEGGKGFG